jgi:glycosyltransferase involved in cell wall biosynthesis
MIGNKHNISYDKKIKILIDPEVFFYDRCGLVRYYSKLIEVLSTDHEVDIDLPLLLSGSDFIEGKHQYLRKFMRELPFGRNLFNKICALSKLWYWKKITSGNYDLVLITSPTFEDKFIKYLPEGKKFMMVVHDTMQCVLTPDGLYDAPGLSSEKLTYLARRASKVICISMATKRDLLQICGGTLNNVEVIYTGNLFNHAATPILLKNLPSKYLLFVGDRSGRKNFRFFLQAIVPLLKMQSDLKIVCTRPISKYELDSFNALGVNASVIFIEAPDSILKTLYDHAIALVYPSLYEGFGLPVLEAMSVGCPVVTTSMSAIPEIAKDAVIYVDPSDAVSILNGINQVISPDFDRNTYIQKGVYLSRQLSVDVMANHFNNSMRELVNF